MKRYGALLFAASTLLVSSASTIAGAQDMLITPEQANQLEIIRDHNSPLTTPQAQPSGLPGISATPAAVPALPSALPTQMSQALPVATVIDGTDGNFQQIAQGSTPMLLEFYATWCPHCSKMSTVMQSMAQQYNGKVKVVRVDIDKNPGLVKKFNVSGGVPHFFVLNNGKVVDSIVGETTASRLSAGLSKGFM